MHLLAILRKIIHFYKFLNAESESTSKITPRVVVINKRKGVLWFTNQFSVKSIEICTHTHLCEGDATLIIHE